MNWEPLKAEAQEMFGDSNNGTHKVSIYDIYIYINMDVYRILSRDP